MIFDRTQFKSGIVAEFGIPNKQTGKVVILCDGAPTVPSKGHLIKFLVKRGYAVFHIRYRGTWESSGSFLEFSPEQDILDVLDEIPRGFTGVWGEETHAVQIKDAYIICSSFGGPAGFLAAQDEKVKKVIVVCPVVSWADQASSEPIDEFRRQIESGYRGAYRMVSGGWEKLKSEKFYNPVLHESETPGEKILIIQTKDDDVVLPDPVQDFAQKTGSRLTMLKKGGHIGASKIMKWPLWWKVRRFLRSP